MQIHFILTAVTSAIVLAAASAYAEQNQSGGPTSTPTHTVPAKPGKAIEELVINRVLKIVCTPPASYP